MTHSGARRWLSVACVLTFLVLCFVASRRPTAPTVSIRLAHSTLQADGTSSTLLEIQSTTHRSLQELQLYTTDLHRLRVDELNINGDHARATLIAGVVPGRVGIEATLPTGDVTHAQLELTLDTNDSEGDGTPDFLRLASEADRQAFRRWFAFIAETQFLRQPETYPEVKDCAGLLRFSFQEALRHHSSSWGRALHLKSAAEVPDVKQYDLPFTPLGSSVFRTRPGRFQASDLHDGTFADFADANTLRRYNTHFVSRDIRRARRGDILFYRQFGQRSPYHAMIVLDRSQLEEGPGSYIVYHTGPIGNTAGEIRRPTVGELLRHPDPRWHPVPDNPAFLGVYRWNILYGAE